jgi:hypothetical protein
MLPLRAWLLLVGFLGVPMSSWGADNMLVGAAPPPRPPIALSRLLLTPGTDTPLFRQPPTFSSGVGSRPSLLVPYLGLGFSRGTTTDLSGTMMRESAQQMSLQDERLLRDMVGKSVMPNEVQLGIRLPF